MEPTITDSPTIQPTYQQTQAPTGIQPTITETNPPVKNSESRLSPFNLLIPLSIIASVLTLL